MKEKKKIISKKGEKENKKKNNGDKEDKKPKNTVNKETNIQKEEEVAFLWEMIATKIANSK
eukprot:gene6335-10342_t